MTLPVAFIGRASTISTRRGTLKFAIAAGDAATELVLSQQATWLATRHRPAEAEIEQFSGLILRLVGLAGDEGTEEDT